MNLNWMTLAIGASLFFSRAMNCGPLDGAAATANAATEQSAISDSTRASLPAEGPLSRWLTLDHLDFSIRYRNSATTNGERVFSSGQQRNLVSGKVKFDRQGQYFVGFRASSGRYFNWSYSTFSGVNFSNDTSGFGIPVAATSRIFTAIGEGASAVIPQSRGWNFYMRELYMSASPFEHVTFEFGGLGFDRGLASEITTFDEDGYLSGERVRVSDKEHLYFDKISTTFGYVGNHYTPNFFARGTDLGRNNYRQVAVEKAFGSRVAFSGEYDFLGGIHTVREAGRAGIKEARVLDTARVEFYQRLNTVNLERQDFAGATGWSVAGLKSVGRKALQLEGGYASIDRDYGVYSLNRVGTLAGFSLNGDSYQVGERLFARASYTPHPYVTLFGFFTHEINSERDASYTSFNRQNIQGGLTINFKAMLAKTGLF